MIFKPGMEHVKYITAINPLLFCSFQKSLETSGKELSPVQLDRIIDAEQTQNPLFLKVTMDVSTSRKYPAPPLLLLHINLACVSLEPISKGRGYDSLKLV